MLSVVHYVWELRHTFCCCHCLVDAASPEGRHAPIWRFCACVGIRGFLDVAPVAHYALPVIVAHAWNSFRSHDGYMWVWHARCLAFQ